MKVSLLIVALVTLPRVAATQQPSADSLHNSAIEGQVLNANSSQPVSKATIVLNPLIEPAQPRSASTDERGHFAIEGLGPGKYILMITHQGYMEQDYGQPTPYRPGKPLSLTPGQRIEDLVIRLEPLAAISGVVLDENGEPLAGVQVQALRFSYANGQRQLVQNGGSPTNDLGQYRLFGLTPGRYYLNAMINSGTSDPKGTSAYAPVFYPDATDSSLATEIEVRSGEDLQGFDISAVPVPAVAVRGRVVNAVTGETARDVAITLMATLGGGMNYSVGQGSFDPAKGTFEIRGVPPGTYVLVAQQWNDPKLNKPFQAQETIEVGNSDEDDLTVAIAPLVELTGRVRVEGKAELNFNSLNVNLEPKDLPLMGWLGRGVSIKPDGSFEVGDLSQGTYNLRLYGLPENFYLKSARVGSDEALDSGVTITSSKATPSLELIVSPRGARIQGVVLNEQQPAPDARVVLVPEPPRRSQAQYYVVGATDRNGRFTLAGAAPGDYKLFAWDLVEGDAFRSSEFLSTYESRGKAVHVDEGRNLDVQLELIPTAE